MKTCSVCKKSLSFDNFVKSTNKDGLHSWCKSCQHDKYKADRPNRIKKAHENTLKYRETVRAITLPLLQEGCIDCGYSDIRALDFDHVRGKKVLAISAMINKGFGLSKIKEELDKCEVRCKNCHAVRTAERSENAWWHEKHMAG